MSSLVPLNDDTIGWWQNVLIYGDAPDAIHNNASAPRILDVRHRPFNLGLQYSVFKHTVAIFSESAVLKD